MAVMPHDAADALACASQTCGTCLACLEKQRDRLLQMNRIEREYEREKVLEAALAAAQQQIASLERKLELADFRLAREK